jgi:PTS system cellobiose-specific IIC component
MHGDNMMLPLVTPMTYRWVAENAQAVSQGVPLNQLPHIWTTVVERISMWPASVWSVLALMWFSRLKQARTLAIIATPAAIFTIVEPVIFGLPLVLNPFLIIPFVLSGTISSLITYAAFSLEWINRVFVELPWATPPFISGYIATGGDWMALVLIVINFLLGLVIYYPFWKAYERSQLADNIAETNQN